MGIVDVPVTSDGDQLVIAIAEAGGVPKAVFGASVGTLADYEDDIRRALERIFTGF